jgi:hypothetical protein
MAALMLIELAVVALAWLLFWDAMRQTDGRESLASRLTRHRERRLADEAEQWLTARGGVPGGPAEGA